MMKLFPRTLRKTWAVGCASMVTLALTTPVNATTPAEQAVLAPLQALLDGLARRDKERVTGQLLPGGNATLMRGGKPIQLTFDSLADRVTQPEPASREERMRNPLVRIDHDVALIWTSYVFLIEGKVDHCGTDIVNLVQVDGKWLIAGLADTSRKECKGW